MITPRKAGVLLALFTALAVAGRAGETVDAEGRFAATFPASVKRSSQFLDTVLGRVTMHQVYTDQGTTSCLVIFTDYPAGGVARSGGVSTVYANAAQGAVKSVNGTLLSQAECKLGDLTGMDLVVDAPQQKEVAHARYFIVGDRFFQEIFVGPPGAESGKEALAFLDSFRLLH